jgi:hypothetical protein
LKKQIPPGGQQLIAGKDIIVAVGKFDPDIGMPVEVNRFFVCNFLESFEEVMKSGRISYP